MRMRWAPLFVIDLVMNYDLAKYPKYFDFMGKGVLEPALQEYSEAR